MWVWNGWDPFVPVLEVPCSHMLYTQLNARVSKLCTPRCSTHNYQQCFFFFNFNDLLFSAYRFSIPGVKRSGREVHTPLSSVEVTNE